MTRLCAETCWTRKPIWSERILRLVRIRYSAEEAGMELLYTPYVPNKAEYLILTNRKILSDQMGFLVQHVSAHSRVMPHAVVRA